MVDIKADWNERNLKEYVKYTISKNKISKISLLFFTICSVFILVFCLTAFFAFKYVFALVFALVIVFITAGYVVFFAVSIKRFTQSMLKANAEPELNRIMISDDDILCFNGDEPIGTLSWSKMADIYFNEKEQAAYLTSKGNAVLILECKNILSGTSDELKEIIGKKRDELSKEA